jgi:hypothetical protein
MNPALMSLRIVSSSGVSSGTPGRGEPVLISTNPPGMAGSDESMKDPGSHFASGDEVPLIVGFDVGESRAAAEHGRVDACGMYMFGGSTSTEVEGGASDIEVIEGSSRHPGRGSRVERRVVHGAGVGVDDMARAEGGGNYRRDKTAKEWSSP